MPYQPLPIILLAAVLGIATDRFCPVPFTVWFITFFVTLLAWGMTWRTKMVKTPAMLILLACFCFFGFLHHQRWSRFAENDLGRYAVKLGEPAAVRGAVSDMPRFIAAVPPEPGRIFSSEDRTVFTLQAEQLRDGTDWIPITGRVSVTVAGDQRHLRIGDSLELFGELSKPLGPQNPCDFDYARFLRSKKILCQMRCSSGDAITVRKMGSQSVARFFETFRRAGQKRLERFMTPDTAPLAAAMLLGIREGVDEETTQNLIETGTMHILAISGLHIGLMAATVGLLLSFCGVSRRKTAITLMLTVLVYLFLTDVRPPAIRATVLVCTISVAIYSDRRALGVNTLCATALVVLALNPAELFQFGAQLSFLATGAFFWVPRLEQVKSWFFKEQNIGINDREVERYEIRRRPGVEFFKRFVTGTVELVFVSLVIWAVTMPLILDRIHLFTPIAVAVNPLLGPPLTASLLSGFAVMILGTLPVVGDFFGPLFGTLAQFSFQVLFGMIECFHEVSATLGGHAWSPGPPLWWMLGFYAVFTFFTFLPIRRPKKTLATLLIVWIIIGYGSGYVRDFVRKQNDRLTVTVFSVGHGNCVLMVTPQGKTVVYDVGCMASSKKAADILSRGLWRLGKTRVDALVLSHSDNDHINGVVPLADRFDIGAVYVSPWMLDALESCKHAPPESGFEQSLFLLREKLVAKGIPIQSIASGDTLQELPHSRVLHPPREPFGESDVSNATSLVLHFEHRGVGVLLPGDLDGRLTPAFLEGPAPPMDIVMVPHHAGRSNLTEPLLNWAKPKTLLISAGKFTHRADTLEHFRARGYEVHSTFEEGMIEIALE